MGGLTDAWGKNNPWNPFNEKSGFFQLGTTVAKGYDDLTGASAARDKAQALLDKQAALDKARYDANVTAATSGAALQKTSAQGQYDLAVANENAKYQTDDSAQLKSLQDALGNSALSLDQKLSLIDSQVKAGLGTESTKLALNAKMLAQQEYDLNAVGGQRDLQQKQLTQQLQGAQGNILGLQQGRDAGIAQGSNVDATLGLSGESIDRQGQVQQYEANRQIQSAAQQAGYILDQTPTDLTRGTVFDQALQASLSGDNLNQDLFSNNVARTRLGLDTSMQGFGNDVTGLSEADASFRASSDFGLKMNIDNADLALKNAISGANFSFQQSEINTEGQQYKIDQASNLGMNLLQGMSQVALWATNPAVGAGLTGFSKWLGGS